MKLSLDPTIERIQAIRTKQCKSTFVTSKGREARIVFCEYLEGHEGQHKGFRKRWDSIDPMSIAQRKEV